MTTLVTTPTTTPVPYVNPSIGLFGVSFSPVKTTVIGADTLFTLAKGAIQGVSVNPSDLINIGLGGISAFHQEQYISDEGSTEFNLHIEFGGQTIGTHAAVNIHHSQFRDNNVAVDNWWIDTSFWSGSNEYAGVNWYTREYSDNLLGASRTEIISHNWQNKNVFYNDVFVDGVPTHMSIEMVPPILLMGQAELVESIPQFH